MHTQIQARFIAVYFRSYNILVDTGAILFFADEGSPENDAEEATGGECGE